MAKIRIKDTGLNKVGGTKDFINITYGVDNWIPLDGFSLRHEFNVMTSDNQSTKTTGNYFSGQTLNFQSNEVTGIISPRLTLQGIVATSNATKIRALIGLNRTMGIKQLSGGAGIIDAYPEVATDTYNYISVIVRNFTISEVVLDGTEYAKITIQLEQVN